MTPERLAELSKRLVPTSDTSVTVYDRPADPAARDSARIIGTVHASPRGVEAKRNHYSLADRAASIIPGPHATVGDGVEALIADVAAYPDSDRGSDYLPGYRKEG